MVKENLTADETAKKYYRTLKYYYRKYFGGKPLPKRKYDADFVKNYIQMVEKKP